MISYYIESYSIALYMCVLLWGGANNTFSMLEQQIEGFGCANKYVGGKKTAMLHMICHQIHGILQVLQVLNITGEGIIYDCWSKTQNIYRHLYNLTIHHKS